MTHIAPSIVLWTHWLLAPPKWKTCSGLWIFAQIFTLKSFAHPTPTQHHPHYMANNFLITHFHPVRPFLYSTSNSPFWATT